MFSIDPWHSNFPKRNRITFYEYLSQSVLPEYTWICLSPRNRSQTAPQAFSLTSSSVACRGRNNHPKNADAKCWMRIWHPPDGTVSQSQNIFGSFPLCWNRFLAIIIVMCHLHMNVYEKHALKTIGIPLPSTHTVIPRIFPTTAVVLQEGYPGPLQHMHAFFPSLSFHLPIRKPVV